MFDIDATSGALTQVEAEGIPIPGMRIGVALSYSGKVLAVTGGDAAGHEVFQRAGLDQALQAAEFESLPDSPCPEHSCDDGTLYMLNEELMLSANVVLDVDAKVPETYKAGVSSYEVGGAWGPVASYLTHRPGPRDLTAIGSRYFGSEDLSMNPFEIEAGEFQTSEYGHSWIEEFAEDGAPEGYFELPGTDRVPDALLALGSQLYVANASEGFGAVLNGDRLTPSEGTATELGSPLGAAMAGFLTGESKGVEAEKEATKEAVKESGAQSGSKAGEYALTVTLAGAGMGQVAGTGIACPGTCSASYPAGTLVALVADPAPGFTFTGWAGSCAGTGTCNVTMSAPRAVTATFSSVPPPNTKIVSIKHSGKRLTIRFKGSGGYGKLTFHCRLGTAKKAAKCSSPLVYTHLAPGKHRFSVAAADSRPIVDPTPAKATFVTKS